MLSRTVIGTTAFGTAVLLLLGCGGGAGGPMNSSGSMSSGTSTPVLQQSQAQALDAQQLLAMAQVTSETTDPKPVGNGALLADADDQTSEPIPVG